MLGLSYEAEDVSSNGFFCPSFCYGYLGYGRRKRSGAVCPSYCYAVNMGRKKRGVSGTGSNQVYPYMVSTKQDNDYVKVEGKF